MDGMRRHQRGIVVVLVVMGLLALFAMVGLAIDTGHLILNKSRLQATVDSAALAAAKVLDAARPQGLVKRFPRDTCRLSDIGHATSAGDVTQRGGQKPRVVGLQDVSQVCGNGLVAVEVGSGIECRQFVNLDSCTHLRFLSQSNKAASAFARLMSLFCVRLDPPASRTTRWPPR